MRLLSLGFLARISTSVCLGFTTLPLQPKALTSINLGQAKGRRMDSIILVICSDPSTARQTSQKALEEAGWKGKIILITKNDRLPPLDEVEGLLLTGGKDIDPKYWSVQESLHKKADPDDARTDLEIKVINHAQEKNLPILGLCRGHQILNVALGGSMYQHLPDENIALEKTQIGKWDDQPQELPHSVSIDPTSQLANILGVRDHQMRVNSRHHQAVKTVGIVGKDKEKGKLKISAWDPEHLIDGKPLIEAVESSDPSRFIVGVQWHPENLTHEEGVTGEAARNLFKGFLDAIRQKRK